MSKKNQGNKGGADILEDPNALREKIQDSEVFFEKNKKIITYVGGGIVLAILAFFFFKYQKDQSNETAQGEMYNAVFAWEKDSLKTALEGDKTNRGLLEVADEYSGTDAGNLASYYAGVAFLKEGKFDEAIEQLGNFKSSDYLLQGLAYSLIGDAYMEKNELPEAINYYKKAANYNPNEAFTPGYLMKLGLAYELNKEFKSASGAYDQLIKDYPASTQVREAKKYMAKAEGLSAAK